MLKFSLARLRGFMLIIVLVISMDWGVKHLVIPLLGITPEVYNPTPPNMYYLGALLTAGMLLSTFSRSTLLLLFAGLLCGGAAANLLDAQLFGPVADFIRRPFSDYYCNLADLALYFSFIPLTIYLFRGLLRNSFALPAFSSLRGRS